MRRPRVQVAHGIYHVGTRGNRRQSIFVDGYDRQGFFDRLGRVIAERGWRCLTYCLMTNHYHLLIETPYANVGSGMHQLNGGYAQWFNRRHGFSGHVFERRYHDELVEDEPQFMEASRYIVLNPVRANICVDPVAWPWSSYRAVLGQETSPVDLALDRFFELFGGDRRTAPQRFGAFVRAALHGHVRVPGTGTWREA